MGAKPGQYSPTELEPFSPLLNENDSDWLGRIGPNKYKAISEFLSPEGPPNATQLWGFLYVEVHGPASWTEELNAYLAEPIMDAEKYTGPLPTISEVPLPPTTVPVSAITPEPDDVRDLPRFAPGEDVTREPVRIPTAPPRPVQFKMPAGMEGVKPWMLAIGAIGIIWYIMKR